MSLKGSNKSSKAFRISVAETVMVPGIHEMILLANLKGTVSGNSVLGTLEPCPGFAE